jgi:hypothetical protein
VRVLLALVSALNGVILLLNQYTHHALRPFAALA